MDPYGDQTSNVREAKTRDVSRVLSSVDHRESWRELYTALKEVEKFYESRAVYVLFKLVRKVLRCGTCAECLSSSGSRFEMFLNIVGNRSNFGLFLKNLLRGKVVVPSKKSPSFVSTIGHVDNRVNLDKNITPGTNKYFATLSAMASKLAYENVEFIRLTVEKKWEMQLLGAYDFWDETYQAPTTQIFMFRDQNADADMIFIAFRGTEPFSAADWSTDFDISPYTFHGNVHAGFMKALGLNPDGKWPETTKMGEHLNAYNTITQELKSRFVANQRTKFILTGHSLGGALAVLFPAVLELHGESEVLERLEGVYTFGQPKVGDEKFGRFMKEQFEHYGIGYYRFVYSHDIVPRLPFDSSEMTFKHFETCIYVNSLYEGKVAEEEPLEDYFNLRAVFTHRADALWELVRSFFLPHMFGPEYKEGLLLKMFRMIGLICPGLPAHGPQDYINATRLATY